jgi:hypothetical protein
MRIYTPFREQNAELHAKRRLSQHHKLKKSQRKAAAGAKGWKKARSDIGKHFRACQ